MALQIVLAVIGSGLLSVLVTEISAWHKAKISKKTGLESKVDDIIEEMAEQREALRMQEKDSLRIELKLMISDYPDEETDILRLAEYYFVKLKGNWTMANVFRKWCEEHDVSIPNWFDNE